MRCRRPTRLKAFSYKGKHCYFITCSTAERRKRFEEPEIVNLVAQQILRTCKEREFEILAYAFMDDHVHLLIRGTSGDSDFRSTMALLRKRTALAYRRSRQDQLWQDGYFERVLRPSDDVFEIIRYIRENPVEANLSDERTRYPYVWSTAAVRAPVARCFSSASAAPRQSASVMVARG